MHVTRHLVRHSRRFSVMLNGGLLLPPPAKATIGDNNDEKAIGFNTYSGLAWRLAFMREAPTPSPASARSSALGLSPAEASTVSSTRRESLAPSGSRTPAVGREE